MSLKPLFDAKDPYASIAKFTSGQAVLPDPQKNDFLIAVETFFADRAFRDLVCPPGDHKNRLIQQDLEMLKSLVEKFHDHYRPYRIGQLLANISKVAGLTFNGVFQVIVNDENTPLLWGWVPGKYVNSSQKLLAAVKDGRVELNLRDVKPSVLFALQRMCQAAFGINNLHLSFEALFDLTRFAIDWDVKQLQEELKKYFIDMEMPPQDFYLREALKNSSPETTQALTKLKNVLPRATSLVVYHAEFEQDGGSAWFNAETPYASINAFCSRCTTLSQSEQKQFFSTVNRFFATCAYRGETKAILPSEERIFSRIALPFLLSAMQLTEENRKRLIACVQMVTKRAFPHLNKGDQLRIVQNTKEAESQPPVQMSWVVGTPIQSDQSTVPLSIINVNNRLMSTDPACDTLLDLFLLAEKEGIPAWRQAALERIKQKLTYAHSREPMCQMIVKYLHHLPIQAVIPSLGDFYPNPETLDADDLYAWIKFRIARKEPIQEILNTALGALPVRESILARLWTEASEAERKGIQAYYRQRICDCIQIRDSDWRIFFLSYLLQGEVTRDEIITELKCRREKQKRSATESSLRPIHAHLQTDAVKQLCAQGDMEVLRVQAVSILEELFPQFLVRWMMPRFLQEFFPALKDRHPHIPILQRMIEVASMLCEQPSKDFEAKLLAKQPTLSDQEVVSIFKVLRGERVKQWLTAQAPQVNYDNLLRFCNEGYGADILVLLDDIGQEIAKADPKNEHLRERGFIHKLCAQPRANACEELLDAGITSLEAQWIVGIMSNGEGKILVLRHMGEDGYKLLMEMMAKLVQADALANKFATGMPLEPHRHKFLEEFFKRIYMMGGVWVADKIEDLRKKYDVEIPDLIRIAEILVKPGVQNWFNDTGDVFGPLNQFFDNYFNAPTPVYLDVHSFMDTAKPKLSPESASALKLTLINIGMSSDSSLDRLIQVLKPGETTEIRHCLQTDAAKRRLTSRNLPNAVTLLVENLAPLDPSSRLLGSIRPSWL